MLQLQGLRPPGARIKGHLLHRARRSQLLLWLALGQPTNLVLLGQSADVVLQVGKQSKVSAWPAAAAYNFCAHKKSSPVVPNLVDH